MARGRRLARRHCSGARPELEADQRGRCGAFRVWAGARCRRAAHHRRNRLAVVLDRRLGALLRQAGSRPGGRVTSSVSPEEVTKKRRPGDVAPRAARGALRCSVFAASRRTRYAPCRRCARTAARSQKWWGAHAPGCKALRFSPTPTGGARLAAHRPTTGRSPWRTAPLIKPMRSEMWLVLLLLFGPRGRRRGAQGFGAARSAFVI